MQSSNASTPPCSLLPGPHPVPRRRYPYQAGGTTWWLSSTHSTARRSCSSCLATGTNAREAQSTTCLVPVKQCPAHRVVASLQTASPSPAAHVTGQQPQPVACLAYVLSLFPLLTHVQVRALTKVRAGLCPMPSPPLDSGEGEWRKVSPCETGSCSALTGPAPHRNRTTRHLVQGGRVYNV